MSPSSFDKVYYHPNRVRRGSAFTSPFYHEVICFFLETVEKIAPEVISDLYSIASIMQPALKIVENQRKKGMPYDSLEFPEDWKCSCSFI